MQQQVPRSGQSQPRRSNAKGKQLDVSSNSTSANVVDKRKGQQQPVSKVAYKRPSRGNIRYGVDTKREKAFSKNEQRIVSVQDILNFQYASNDDAGAVAPHRSSKVYWKRKNPFFNKEEYLQAKCQFVVIGEANDFTAHAGDPDLLVDWRKVYLVYIPSHDPPNCPICLYPPVIAKITKCGHIFCWSCMLHYLQLSEKTWQKCPICHEAVHQKDLKSVKPYLQKRFARLDSISMTLMRCAKGSSLVHPKGEGEYDMQFSSWSKDSFRRQTKIMLATPEEIVCGLLLKEKEELQAHLHMVEESEDVPYVEMALEIIQQEIESFDLDLKVLAQQEREGVTTVEEQQVESLSLAFRGACMDDVTLVSEEILGPDDAEKGVAFVEDYISEDNSDNISDNINLDPEKSPFLNSDMQSTNDSFYFYQSDDRQNIFLHSLNARCLIEEYGSLEYGPTTIKGQIIDFECLTMTKELRKRFRYLSHLPLCTEFMICELILKPPLLSKRTIHNFMPEFKHRKDLRLKKMNEQRKFDTQAKVLENKNYGFPINAVYEEQVEIDLNNLDEFPSNLSADNYQAKHEEVSSFNSSSFAQVLDNKKDQASGQRSFQNTVSHQTYLPIHETTVSSYGNDDEADVFAPDFKETFSAAMFAAPFQESNHVGGKGKGKGKQKRKDKGMLLFATGGQRKY